MSEIVEINKFILNTYKRLNILIDGGCGAYLQSRDQKYLDFTSGIGVNSLGYGHSEFCKVLGTGIGKPLHVSNLFYTYEQLNAAKRIIQSSGLGKVFFTNSGTEAIEGALKLVKKYANDKGIKNYNIISMKNSFHGRSIGALSLSYNKKYKDPFSPLLKNIRFAKFNSFDSVKKLCDKSSVAIILEPIQGEGGIRVAKSKFLKKLRKYCDDKKILLIFDEIQSGMGRSGRVFACEHSNVRPDILVCAKGLGNGVPVGCFIVDDKLSNVLTTSMHGSTFGGNPFALRAVSAVFDIFEKHRVVENVAKLSKKLESILDNFVKEYSFCLKRSGRGFMQGLEIDESMPVSSIIVKAQERGLLLLTCGKNQLRFLPPLIISENEIYEMQKKLSIVFNSML